MLTRRQTNHFKVMKAEREANARQQGGQQSRGAGLRSFLKDSGTALRDNWFLFIYLVVVMTGFNSCSHGSQDFYPTFLKDQLGMTKTQATVITVVGQIGSIFGGTLIGHVSSFFGRRLTMLLSCIAGGAIIPAYILPKDMSLVASAFFQQFFVGGVWGPIPIHLMELSPPALRTSMMGLTYQLGNLASSASATIQSVIGERYPLPPAPDGNKRFDYGRVIGIFMGAVWAFMFFFLFFGPEMTQEERDEEAQEALRLEALRQEGVSLAEIGDQQASKRAGDEDDSPREVDEKASAEHIA